MKLNVSIEQDDVFCIGIDLPQLDVVGVQGRGKSFIEAVEHLHAQLKGPEGHDERMTIGMEGMDSIQKMIDEAHAQKQIRDEVEPFKRLGVEEAWAFTKSDLKDKILVLAVPSISQHQHEQVREHMSKLLEDLFPDEDERPTCTILPEDFVLGTKDEDDIIAMETPDSISMFEPGEPVKIGEVKDLIRRRTPVGMIMKDMVDETNHDEMAVVVLQTDETTLDALDYIDERVHPPIEELPDDAVREVIFRHAHEFCFSAVRVDGMEIMPDGVLRYNKFKEGEPLVFDDEYRISIHHIKKD